MARVFHRMAREVYSREQELKKQVQQLRIEVDEAKQSKQVSEIVDSDFFQDLQAKAREMRAQRRRKLPEDQKTEEEPDES